MQKRTVQISLYDIYKGVSESIEDKKPEIIRLMEEHLDFDSLIPAKFIQAYYKDTGRKHIYHLESLIRALILQKLLGIQTDILLITFLKCSSELRKFCGFNKIPDGSKFTRFRQDYGDMLVKMFDHLVDLTEPICREIDSKKSDYLIYDTTGLEPPVCENNPKFFNSKLKSAKKLSKTDPDFNPYIGVYGLLPDVSSANPNAKQQYINGHFAYALKSGIVTNGLGIIRHISFFDDCFKNKHPETVTQKTDNPDNDKELSDSVSLKPVLSDFFEAHPNLKYKTFIADSAFDSYNNYSLLRNDFHFERAVIPLNARNSKASSASFDIQGTPVCPVDGTPFKCLGKSGGKNRSIRFKWVCHKSLPKGSKRICTCENPCTNSSYGKCVYTYPDKDFRFCPGIQRNTEHWDNLYRHRVNVERTINLMKDSFALDSRKSFNSLTLKADLFLAGIVQLVGVLLAKALHKPQYFRSVRKLIA